MRHMILTLFPKIDLLFFAFYSQLVKSWWWSKLQTCGNKS